MDDEGQFRCLPYFHLIGICKSGTSDFFKRLLLHPDILPNRGIFGKEIWYWSWKRFSISKLDLFRKLFVKFLAKKKEDSFFNNK
jgi:hypothetical protein